MAEKFEFAPSRFQLIQDIWTDIKFAVCEEIKDADKQKAVLANIRRSLCDRLFPAD